MIAALAQFLHDRYDEEAALAEAASPGPWHVNAESDEVLAVDGATVADGFALSGRQLRATTEYIARHDPANSLADVDAKREIVTNLAAVEMEQAALRELRSPLAEVTLRMMTRPYRAHPDFDPVWLEN